MKKFFLVVIFFATFFLLAHSAIANITNGTFNTDLSYWTTVGLVQQWYPGVAQLAPQLPLPGEVPPENDNSSLSQGPDYFTLEENSKTLSFYVAMDITETHETDIFTASLDGTQFYSWDSSGNETPDNESMWLTDATDSDISILGPDTPMRSRTVNLNLLALSLSPGGHTLTFNLFNDYEDNVNTYIYIDNVNISGELPAVPGPDSLILCCIGGLSFFLFRRKVL